MTDPRFFLCTSCHGVNRIPASRIDSHPACGRCKTALPTSGDPMEGTDADLDRWIAKSPVPLLVDFHADWCPPCKALSPILKTLAHNHAGRLLVIKVDTEQHKRHASRLGVQGIPAVFLFRDGRKVGEASGLRPLAAWEELVAPHLG